MPILFLWVRFFFSCTVELKIDYVLGFIFCEIFAVLTFHDWVGWGIFALISGYPRRTTGDSQHLEARPELQDWLWSEFQERKSSPKRKFSGRISRGRPGVIRADLPKLWSGPSKPWKNKHLGADIHDPKARTSTTLRDFQKLRSDKLWAEFLFPRIIYRKKLQDRDLFEIRKDKTNSNSTVQPVKGS